MNGLRPEIKRRVRIHGPYDLYRAMQLALDVEEEMIEEQGSNFLNRASNFSSVGAIKGAWLIGRVGSGRIKGEIGSGNYYTTPNIRKVRF